LRELSDGKVFHLMMFNFGHAIKDLRIKVGLSQKELAAGICTQAQISKIEKCNDIPSALLLNQIANKLGVDMNYFFEMQESHKVEYIKNSREYIRNLIRYRDYENLYTTVREEKKHPYYQEKENLQFLLWHEAICMHYIENDSEKALEILNEAMLLTRNKQYYTEQEIEMLNSIAIILRETQSYEESKKRFQEALEKIKEVPKISDPTVEIRIIFGLAQLLTDIESFQESLQHCEKGISLCKELETLYLYGELLYQKGENLARMGQKNLASESFEHSIHIFELQNNTVLIQSVKENQTELLGLDDVPN
jgi:transcriptional regulator with XRE-family HTH domain